MASRPPPTCVEINLRTPHAIDATSSPSKQASARWRCRTPRARHLYRDRHGRDGSCPDSRATRPKRRRVGVMATSAPKRARARRCIRIPRSRGVHSHDRCGPCIGSADGELGRSSVAARSSGEEGWHRHDAQASRWRRARPMMAIIAGTDFRHRAPRSRRATRRSSSPCEMALHDAVQHAQQADDVPRYLRIFSPSRLLSEHERDLVAFWLVRLADAHEPAQSSICQAW